MYLISYEEDDEADDDEDNAADEGDDEDNNKEEEDDDVVVEEDDDTDDEEGGAVLLFISIFSIWSGRNLHKNSKQARLSASFFDLSGVPFILIDSEILISHSKR